MREYFNELNNFSTNKVVKEMYKYAKSNKVPIISDDGLLYILQLIRLTNAKKILEIGTAIGYSSINMALINENIIVDTIERDSEMFKLACDNIKNAKVDKQITIINADALEVDEKILHNDYDLIFIDAAKAQYIKFFQKYEKLLNNKGIIVSDNLLFHGLVETNNKIDSKNLRALISKIKEYNSWLSKNKNYRTTFLEIGDGMAVSEKI